MFALFAIQLYYYQIQRVHDQSKELSLFIYIVFLEVVLYASKLYQKKQLLYNTLTFLYF